MLFPVCSETEIGEIWVGGAFPLPTSYFPLPCLKAQWRHPTFYFSLKIPYFLAGKPSADFPLHTSYISLPSSHFSLPTSYFPLPTSLFPLPTSQFPLPTSHFRLPTFTWTLPFVNMAIAAVYGLVSAEYISQHCFFGGYKHVMYVVIFLCTLMYMPTRAYAVLPSCLPAATGR